jgi:exopolysaccharide biosynthesis protein
MLTPDEIHPILAFLQLTLATLAVGGIGWIIKRAIAVENEIIQAKYDMKAEISRNFTRTDIRISKLENDLASHARLDDERVKTADAQRERLNNRINQLVGRKTPPDR